MTFDDPDLLVAAALHGAGLACTLEDHVATHLADGRLVRVLEDWCEPFPASTFTTGSPATAGATAHARRIPEVAGGGHGLSSYHLESHRARLRRLVDQRGMPAMSFYCRGRQ